MIRSLHRLSSRGQSLIRSRQFSSYNKLQDAAALSRIIRSMPTIVMSTNTPSDFLVFGTDRDVLDALPKNIYGMPVKKRHALGPAIATSGSDGTKPNEPPKLTYSLNALLNIEGVYLVGEANDDVKIFCDLLVYPLLGALRFPGKNVHLVASQAPCANSELISSFGGELFKSCFEMPIIRGDQKFLIGCGHACILPDRPFEANEDPPMLSFAKYPGNSRVAQIFEPIEIRDDNAHEIGTVVSAEVSAEFDIGVVRMSERVELVNEIPIAAMQSTACAVRYSGSSLSLCELAMDCNEYGVPYLYSGKIKVNDGTKLEWIFEAQNTAFFLFTQTDSTESLGPSDSWFHRGDSGKLVYDSLYKHGIGVYTATLATFASEPYHLIQSAETLHSKGESMVDALE